MLAAHLPNESRLSCGRKVSGRTVRPLLSHYLAGAQTQQFPAAPASCRRWLGAAVGTGLYRLPKTDQFGIVDQATDRTMHALRRKTAVQANSSQFRVRERVGACQNNEATKAGLSRDEKAFERRLVDARPESGALFGA